MRCFVMFVTAVCILFLLKLKWPKNKSLYDIVIHTQSINAKPFLPIMPVGFVVYAFTIFICGTTFVETAMYNLIPIDEELYFLGC